MTNDEPMMTPGEVGRLFEVNAKTVSRWAAQGKVRGVRTPGGRWRISSAHVSELLTQLNGTGPVE